MINFEILASSGEILVWDNQCELHWSSFVPDPRYLTINQNVGGTVSSDKLSGYDDDEVTLSNTVSSDYIFDNYSITGAVLTGDKFRFSGSDVTAEGEFTPIPTRHLTINQSVGGTVTANKTTGHDGDIVTLSNTATGNYHFSSYSITGATLTGNQFEFNNSDVTAQASFTSNLIASGNFANTSYQFLVEGSSTHSTGHITTKRGVSTAISIPQSGYLVATRLRTASNPEYYSLSWCNQASLSYDAGLKSGIVKEMNYVSSEKYRSDTFSSKISAAGYPYTIHICDSVADYGWSGKWYFYRNL